MMKNVKRHMLFLRGEIAILNLTLLLIFLALAAIEHWTADPPLWDVILFLWGMG